MLRTPLSRMIAAMSLALGLGIFSPARAESGRFDIELRAGDLDRRHSPVKVWIELSDELIREPELDVELTDGDGKTHAAQLMDFSEFGGATHPGTSFPHSRVLHFVVDEMPRATTANWQAVIQSHRDKDKAAEQGPSFHWQEIPSEHADLLFGDRPVLRFVDRSFDASSPEQRAATCRVWHEVFDPTGKILLTKGTGGTHPHHRGIFFGYNNITSEHGSKANLWDCPNGEHQSILGHRHTFGGPVLGRQSAEIAWHGPEKSGLDLIEFHQLTVYRPHADGGVLMEFTSELFSNSTVQLDGSSHHAGVHYRAPQEVDDKSKAQTYYVRPDGIGKPGETRNWPEDKSQLDVPWEAMSFVVGEKRYTVAMLDRPGNPKPAQFSERDYGRFGSFVPYKLTPEEPLRLKYRFWIQAGEMTPEQVAALHADFVHPIEVTAKSVDSKK